MSKNIGFISTRFAGTDGVTLEAGKWAEVLKKLGHSCFWFAGELDKSPENSLLVPEAHFQSRANRGIDREVFGSKKRRAAVTRQIHDIRSDLKEHLYAFRQRFALDILIVENALTIPMQIPLGLALTEFVAETQIPTIAHHHDFFWERVRYSINAVNDYLGMAFPPNLPNIEHVVINSAAREQLAHRRGIASVIIPNVLDFENPPDPGDGRRAVEFRRSIGLEASDTIILQPTRIVKRKGIEYAIGLVKELKDPACKLVISHEAGDEGFEYPEWIKSYAREQGVDLRLVTTRLGDPWADTADAGQPYTLWDIYPSADFITYPSIIEGFGNAFLEAIYFRKPILINRYETFVRDIEPQGFDLVVMDGFVTKTAAGQVKAVLGCPERREKMVSRNYAIAARHYSYSVLQKQLHGILINFFGEYLPPHMHRVVASLARKMILKTAGKGGPGTL